MCFEMEPPIRLEEGLNIAADYRRQLLFSGQLSFPDFLWPWEVRSTHWIRGKWRSESVWSENINIFLWQESNSVGLIPNSVRIMVFNFVLLYKMQEDGTDQAWPNPWTWWSRWWWLRAVSSGSVVVKALCYKPEGRGLETRWGEWIFSI
jgi:hypothetical protein